MKKGACPSVFEPMETGDGLLVRVKPPAGVLSAAAARVLAGAAARFGNGMIDATSRANLQVRGLRPATVAAFAAAMVEAGLAHPDPAVERRRNVIGSPLSGVDGDCSPLAGPVAASLARMLEADGALAALPPKFGFAVDGGGALGLAGVRADIAIRMVGDRCEVTLDGGQSVARGAGVEIAQRLAHAFLRLGPTAPRMRALLEAAGEEAAFAAAGLDPAPGTVRRPAAAVPAGYLADLRTFAVGLPFGAVPAGALTGLAEVAERYGDGSLRLTPWRVLLLPGVTDAEAVRRVTLRLGLIGDAQDKRLAIAACPGRPACGEATVDTRKLATALARLAVPGSVHVSGCAKGCAHPGAASVTLVGREGRFDLVRDGGAGDPAARAGLSPEEVVAALAPAEAVG